MERTSFPPSLVGAAAVVALAVLAASPAPAQNGARDLFGAPRFYRATDDLALVAVDLDGDGDADLASAEPPTIDGFGQIVTHGAVHVVGNVPPYSTLRTRTVATELGGQVVVAGDLDGDGIMDLVTSNVLDHAGNVNDVFIGLGSGRFLPAVSYGSTGDGAGDLALGDLDGDGDLDLVVPNGGRPWYNDGQGNFSRPFVGGDVAQGGSIALGDLDEDGALDVVTAAAFFSATRDWVTLQFGDGSGNPGAPTQVSVGGISPKEVALEDVDGDGHLDLITANTGSSDVSVLLGRGDGTFAAPVTFRAHPSPLAPEPLAMAFADFDLDGRLDVVVTSLVFGNATSHVETGVFYGDGAGGFVLDQLVVGFGTRDQDLIAFDVEGDGDVDLVTPTHVLLDQLR